MLCAKFLWNWPSGSGGEDLKILSMYFCHFVIHFEQTWIPFIQRCFVPSWNRLSGSYFVNVFSLFRNSFEQTWISFFVTSRNSWEEDFKTLSMYFPYFVFISPWKRVWPFIWTNLNPLHPRMFCANFDWNWWKCVKFTDGRTDDRCLSFQLWWAYKEIPSI